MKFSTASSLLRICATFSINAVLDTIGDTGVKQEVRNEKALHVYNRVQHKLTGTFVNEQP